MLRNERHHSLCKFLSNSFKVSVDSFYNSRSTQFFLNFVPISKGLKRHKIHLSVCEQKCILNFWKIVDVSLSGPIVYFRLLRECNLFLTKHFSTQDHEESIQLRNNSSLL